MCEGISPAPSRRSKRIRDGREKTESQGDADGGAPKALREEPHIDRGVAQVLQESDVRYEKHIETEREAP